MRICTECLQELVDSDKICFKCKCNKLLTWEEYKECKEFFKTHEKDIKLYNQYPFNIYLQYIKHKEKLEKAEYNRLHPPTNNYNYINISKPTQNHKSTPTITCPYCQSTNTKKISGTARWLSVGLFGLSSGKVGKQWHCKKCGSDF